jgi:hypothetical protein
MIGGLGKILGKDLGKDRIDRVPVSLSDVIGGMSPLVGGTDRITRARTQKSNLLAPV